MAAALHAEGKCLLILIIIVNTYVTASNDGTTNGTLVDIRQPRVTGRIVKLYSGPRPDPIICAGEGFQADPVNCAVFYRCTKAGHDRYTIFRFQCGPGTIYDPETEICNHPKNTKRSECTDVFGRTASLQSSVDDVMDNDIHHELPSPIQTSQTRDFTPPKPAITISLPWRSTAMPQTPAKLQQVNPVARYATAKPKSTRQSDNICSTDGFVGDSENCRKFYRCVGNGRGGYIKYEFSCSETTVWDDETQSCNHPWSTKRRRCGRIDENDEQKTVETKPKQEQDADDASSIQEQLQIIFGSKVTQMQQQINKGSNVKQNQTQINYGSNGKQNQKQENHAPNSKQDQKQESQGSAVSQNQQQVNYGDKTVQSQVQIDHTKDASQSQSQVSENEPSYQNTGQSGVSRPSGGNNKCTQSGFMGDSSNCKKFYRCVDNGNGGYTQYEFACGDGTVWDQSIEACNHAWAVKKCDQQEPSHSHSTTPPSYNEGAASNGNTEKPTTSDDSEDGDGYQNQPTNPETKPETTTQQQTTTRPSPSGTKCTSSGFMGDPNDCKKFYRCVDNGKGGYTKYDYTCGEGTVWDQSIEACNHAWAVKECGGSTEEYNKVDTTTKSQITAQPASDSTTDDDESGYGGQPQAPIEQSTTTTQRPQGQNTGDKCTSSGFMGDSKDCKKFYRCVDNGNGGYTRHEFSCGEGTVWDQSIEACNHAWAVKNCGGSQNQPQSETESYGEVQQTTPTPLEMETDEEPSYNQPPPPEPDKDSTDQTSSGSECQQEGFMGDPKDCKKFYRCVDNGKGGFIKYEFTCGEGTVWDQEIQGCNHPTGNNGCSGTQGTQSQESTSKPPLYNDQYTESTETTKTTESPLPDQKPVASGDTCESEGFYGDSNDCKKFYRCVDNGKGGFTKYEFTCGEGTVWDQEIQGCNHASGNEKCKQSSNDHPTQTSTSTDKPASESPDSGTTEKPSQSTSKPSNDQCSEEGFFANSNDCKKFYRCVSNGKGGFTKYDFTCGDGTIWVQEIQACDHDNDVTACSSSSTISSERPQQQSTSSQSQTNADEYPSETTTAGSSTSGNDDVCVSEGFFANKNDCRKFYRCVDNGNGGYTKHDFTCGEGTAWDSDLQTCNHISEVSSCDGSNQQEKEPSNNNEQPEGTTSSTSSSSTESSKPSNDQCEQEGFFGNSQDCKKFYRCVDNGKGGFTKYDFTCGEGTIWDKDVTTCNHPGDVANPSCEGGGDDSSSSNSDDSTTQSSSTSSSGSSESESPQTQKPSNGNVTCDKEGFYPNPNDCKKFYRCVDWDGDGKRFSVFHFECGEGTIWDPALQTCNYEDSVYPPRDCSGSQPQQETTTESSTTTESTTTEESTTESQTTTTTTTEQTTTTTEKESTTQESTTQSTTTEKTTTEASTTTEQTTTTQQSTTTEESTTQQSTTQESTTSEQTTQKQDETTTQQSTTESTTTESQTESSTTESQTDSTTESSTEQESSTTESSDSSNKECPETDEDQNLYVCPTGFRRHPKYCDMFYQCKEDDDTHEVKVAVFNCPNNTIYDESQNQCVDEDKAEKKCDGEKAQKKRFKRLDLNVKQPIVVSKQKHTCAASGHYPFEKNDECSAAFMKCEKTKTGKLRGMVYRCPDGYVYWSVSRRCEPKSYLRHCKSSANDWSGRGEIPVEKRNVAP